MRHTVSTAIQACSTVFCTQRTKSAAPIPPPPRSRWLTEELRCRWRAAGMSTPRRRAVVVERDRDCLVEARPGDRLLPDLEDSNVVHRMTTAVTMSHGSQPCQGPTSDATWPKSAWPRTANSASGADPETRRNSSVTMTSRARRSRPQRVVDEVRRPNWLSAKEPPATSSTGHNAFTERAPP